MREYLAAFCVKDDRHDKQFVIGSMAALSRIVVKANLGTIAPAEGIVVRGACQQASQRALPPWPDLSSWRRANSEAHLYETTLC